MSDTSQAEQNDDTRPSLPKDLSFWGMTITQFLGAFNDNLYKQLMLLLAIPVAVVATGAGAEEATSTSGSDIQGWATLVFSLPFVLFSGIAGYLSDKLSKQPIIVACKVAEIVIMLLGLAAFYYYDLLGTTGTWIVLFLMGTQSAFFGPSKYGILPELFRKEDLPRANSLILMTTFLAIIFGTVLAGQLKGSLVGEGGDFSSLWMGLLVCAGIAVAGTLTTLVIRRGTPAEPNMQLTADSWGVSKDVWEVLAKDRTLLAALLVSSVFWLVSGLAVPTVNRLGLELLAVNDVQTSILTASIGFGIMIGAVFASVLCRRGFGDQCVTIGLTGIFSALIALGIWSGSGNGPVHLLGYGGSIAGLIILGVFAAIFAIPIQVFLQSRPPKEVKGRMIATMNQANFIGILISGPLYQVFEALAGNMNWPICSVFLMMSLLVLPLAAVYRLRS
ncbi:MAG TPA: MFS transporter [Planctomycetaceae bacterium]|nr:MFS transporter [Planctomycetaceae bacterium]